MSRWSVEAWTLPGSSPFERRLMDVPGEIAFTIPTSGVGRIQIATPSVTARLVEILDPANDVGSLLRLVETDRSGVPQIRGEFVVKNTTDPWREGSTVTIQGPTIEDELEGAVVYPLDWPPPIVQPDWAYGNLTAAGSFQNGDMETMSAGVNGDAEAGQIWPWFPTEDNSTFVKPDTFEVNDVDPNSGLYAFYVEPGGVHSGMYKWFDITGGETVTVSAVLKATTSGRRYTMYMKMGEGSTLVTGAKVWNGYAVAELDAAAYEAGASDGTYQTLDLSVTFGPKVTTTDIIIMYDDHDGGVASPFYVDDIVITGRGRKIDGWDRVGLCDVFDWDDTRYRSAGHSLKFHVTAASATAASGARQKITGLVPGVTYTFGAWFSHDSGTAENIALIVQRPEGVWYGSQVTSVPTGTGWTYVYRTVLVDTEEVWVHARHDDAGISPNWWMDDAMFAEGMAPQTVGEILIALFADANIDHVSEAGDYARDTLGWLALDFTAALDSAGNTWLQDESVTLSRGKTFGKVLSDFAALGYEYRVRPNPAYPGAAESHILQVYNPADVVARTGGVGTDKTGTVGFSSGNMLQGDVVRRPKSRTVALAEGADNLFTVAKDTGGVAVWGSRELYVQGRDATELASLDQMASHALVERGASTEASQITLRDDDLFSPFIDFEPGDWVRGGLGGEIPRGNHRVAAITGEIRGGDDLFTLDLGAQVFIGASGTQEAVRRLLAKFDSVSDQRDQPQQATRSSRFTGPIDTRFLVASSQARPEIKDLADFVCDGTDDEAEILSALDAVADSGGPGRVLLSEGFFYMGTNSHVVTLTIPTWCHLQGQGRGSTFLAYNQYPNYDFQILYSNSTCLSKLSIVEVGGCS